MIQSLRYRIGTARLKLATYIGAAVGIPLVLIGGALSLSCVSELIGDALIWIALIVLAIAYGAFHIRTAPPFRGV